MKKKSASRSVVICLSSVLAFTAYSSPARADTTSWTGASSTDWFNATNWDHGVPTASTDVYINNGGKVEINSSGAKARSLTVGLNQADSGTLLVNGTLGGTLDVIGQDCVVTYPKDGAIYLGYRGRGSMSVVSGGRVTSQSAYMAAVSNPSRPGSNGAVKVDGTGSTWAVNGQCDGQLVVSGLSKNDSGGTALVSITSGGTVVVDESPVTDAIWVNPSGTLTGDGTISTTSSVLPTTFVKGTLAPGGTFTIDTNFRLDFFNGVMVSHVSPQSLDRVEVSGYARPGGSLVVIMTGDFRTAPRRYNLLHANLGLGDIEFKSVSIKYPTDQGFEPSVTYDANNAYLDLNFD